MTFSPEFRRRRKRSQGRRERPAADSVYVISNLLIHRVNLTYIKIT